MITFEFVFKIILQILLVFDVVVVILSVFFFRKKIETKIDDDVMFKFKAFLYALHNKKGLKGLNVDVKKENIINIEITPFFFLFKPILTGAITVDKDKQLVKVSCMSLFSWGYITVALLYDLLSSNLSINSDIGDLIIFSIIQILFFVFMGMVLKKYKIFISEVLTFFNYSPE